MPQTHAQQLRTEAETLRGYSTILTDEYSALAYSTVASRLDALADSWDGGAA